MRMWCKCVANTDASVGVRAKSIGRGSNGNDNCKCQCLPHLESFREDLSICIDDIHGKLKYFS